MNNTAFKATPFHACTSALMQTTWWYSWGGYIVPDVYTDVHTEIQAIRHNVSMNEMSPLPKMQITGPEARQFVDYVITRNAAKMQVGDAWYTPWCNHEGKVVADGIVFHFEDDLFIFSGDNSTGFFQQNSSGFDIVIADVTDDYGVLAVQGPNSRAVLETATGEDWGDLPFCSIRTARIEDAELYIARQGFTGELGFELWVQREHGEGIWNAIATAGEQFAIQPAGEYAIDIARVEAGLILVSADYAGAGPDTKSADVRLAHDIPVSPFELGIQHCVNLEKKTEFIGRRALERELERGPERKMVGLQISMQDIIDRYHENGIPPDVSQRVRWDRLAITRDGVHIGYATSVTWSPTAGKMIGFACLQKEYTSPGEVLSVDWCDFWGRELGPAGAEVVDLPFIPVRRN